MTLTKGQIEEAMGRAAYVYELLEVEARTLSLGDVVDDLRAKKQAAEHGGEEYADDVAVLEQQISDREGERQRLTARSIEIAEILWGPGAEPGEKTWQEKVRALPREQALVAIEQVLRRRPEVTPPEDADEWTAEQMREWLVQKISELPEDERNAWTR